MTYCVFHFGILLEKNYMWRQRGSQGHFGPCLRANFSLLQTCTEKLMVVRHTLNHVLSGTCQTALVFFDVSRQSEFKLGRNAAKAPFGLNYDHFQMGIFFFSRKIRARSLVKLLSLPQTIITHWNGFGILYRYLDMPDQNLEKTATRGL